MNTINISVTDLDIISKLCVRCEKQIISNKGQQKYFMFNFFNEIQLSVTLLI